LLTRAVWSLCVVVMRKYHFDAIAQGDCVRFKAMFLALIL